MITKEELIEKILFEEEQGDDFPILTEDFLSRWSHKDLKDILKDVRETNFFDASIFEEVDRIIKVS